MIIDECVKTRLSGLVYVDFEDISEDLFKEFAVSTYNLIFEQGLVITTEKPFPEYCWMKITEAKLET
jgi:hypothetical protein